MKTKSRIERNVTAHECFDGEGMDGMDVITETLQSWFPWILFLGSCDTKTTGRWGGRDGYPKEIVITRRKFT